MTRSLLTPRSLCRAELPSAGLLVSFCNILVLLGQPDPPGLLVQRQRLLDLLDPPVLLVIPVQQVLHQRSPAQQVLQAFPDMLGKTARLVQLVLQAQQVLLAQLGRLVLLRLFPVLQGLQDRKATLDQLGLPAQTQQFPVLLDHKVRLGLPVQLALIQLCPVLQARQGQQAQLELRQLFPDLLGLPVPLGRPPLFRDLQGQLVLQASKELLGLQGQLVILRLFPDLQDLQVLQVLIQ